MKKILAALLVIGSLTCSAQQATNSQPTPDVTYLSSPNLIPSGSSTTWTNTVSGSAGGFSGGSTPAYNAGTNTIIFGYTQQTVAYNYAFSQALQNAGLAIGGYTYSWKINNNDMNTGTLAGKFTLKALNGTPLQTYNYTYNDRTTGDSENFQTFSGTQWFPQNHSSSTISGFSMEWTGKDNRYWAGYYGPRVREPSIQLMYLTDTCSTNPLSSPNCPGYAEAYKTQQCTANPLYDASCPGYAAAYKTQQCAANALYATDCPGYAEAYKTQQCTLDALYATDCPGYETAYKKQQCTLDATYAVDCPGYAAAYKTKQCTLNALYATDCPGYEQAYLNQQCLKDSLFSTKCEGYATAYAIKYLTNLDPAVTTAVNQQLTTTVEIAKADPAKVTIVSSTVDSVLSTPSTTSATSVTSVTSVVNQPPPPPPAASPTAAATNAAAAPPPPPPPAKQEEKAQDQKKTDVEVAKVEKKASGDSKVDAKKEVAAKAAEIAKNAGKATTLEAQTAQQGLLVGLIGYVPGFSGYQQAMIPDTMSAEVARTYLKPVTDNRNAQRRLSGANEIKWQQMVDSQYK